VQHHSRTIQGGGIPVRLLTRQDESESRTDPRTAVPKIAINLKAQVLESCYKVKLRSNIRAERSGVPEWAVT